MNCRQEMRLDEVKIWYELDCCEGEGYVGMICKRLREMRLS